MKQQTMRTLITVVLSLGSWVIGAEPLFAYSIPVKFAECHSLEICLKSLDPIAAISDNSSGPDEQAFARKLSLFGEAAKHELLRRATGEDKGWRNLSGAILGNWKTWSSSDVPALRAGLALDNGGWLAGPLRKIGNHAAIEALVEDLPKGSENQTDFALKDLGAKAIPFLMPLLEDENTAKPAVRLISLMGVTAVPFQKQWSEIADDPDEPLQKRLAAMRAVGALGPRARSSVPSIQPLLKSTEFAVREQAAITLESVQSFEQKIESHVQTVSLIQLIGAPLEYDHKYVRVIAFLRLEFEGDALYLHREDFDHAISANALWFDRPKDLSEKQVAGVNNGYVICEGIFIAREHGHMGMFSGSLTHVSRLEPWGRRAEP